MDVLREAQLASERAERSIEALYAFGSRLEDAGDSTSPALALVLVGRAVADSLTELTVWLNANVGHGGAVADSLANIEEELRRMREGGERD